MVSTKHCLVLYCYDCAITLQEEIDRFWSRKFSQVTLLYMINRYVMLLNRLVRLTDFADWGHRTQTEANMVSSQWTAYVQLMRSYRCEFHGKFMCSDRRTLYARHRCNAIWRLSEVCTVTMHISMAGNEALYETSQY